jgi:hypothetical protein
MRKNVWFVGSSSELELKFKLVENVIRAKSGAQ